MAASDPSNSNGIVTLNVGGELFQTTTATLSRAGSASVLSTLTPSSTPHFLDRDPNLFSHLLSFLRHGYLPTSSTSLPCLLAEADHFSVRPLLLKSLWSDPSRFYPLSLLPSARLPVSGRDAVSVLSLSSDASVVAAHGGKLTEFDPSLATRATVLTPLPAVDSLAAVSPGLVAAGARDFPGLHVCSFSRAAPPAVLSWPESLPSATVLAVATAAAPRLLFGSFESPRRNASAVVAFDVDSLAPVAEIGRKEVFGADVEAAIPATRLIWLAGANLLLAAGSYTGPAGMSGDVRLWDVRASAAAPVWEIREKEDCFADVAASDSLNALFKIGGGSGEVFMADLRRLGGGKTAASETWVCIGDGRKAAAAVAGRKEGSGCRIECYERWVFVARGADVEVWTEVALAPEAGGIGKKVMRKNWVGSGPEADGEDRREKRKKILSWAFAGSRMALARADERCIEVWDSSPAATSSRP